MTVHRTSLALCLALGIALLCPDITLATDLPIYGGLGGQEFRADCPTGSYLVGLSGRTGEWVDNIAPICAPWLVAKQVFGPPSVGPSHGASIGGQKHPADCGVQAGNIHVVQSWKIDILRSDNHYVKHIMAHCLSLSPSASSRVFHFGTKDPYDQNISFGPFGTKPPEQACPAKEAAVGIRGRAGQFVDAIGLICGPLPLGPSAPVMKLPGPLVQGPSPATPINPQTKKHADSSRYVLDHPSGERRAGAVRPVDHYSNAPEGRRDKCDRIGIELSGCPGGSTELLPVRHRLFCRHLETAARISSSPNRDR